MPSCTCTPSSLFISPLSALLLRRIAFPPGAGKFIIETLRQRYQFVSTTRKNRQKSACSTTILLYVETRHSNHVRAHAHTTHTHTGVPETKPTRQTRTRVLRRQKPPRGVPGLSQCNDDAAKVAAFDDFTAFNLLLLHAANVE